MQNIPKLPVPPLEETARRYLSWIAPFVDSSVLKEAEECVEELLSENGAGIFLQRKLEDFSQREDVANWLEPFWIEAYLSERRSLPLYSNNVFYKLALPPTSNEKEKIWRAASLCHWAGRFYNLVMQDELEPEWDHGQRLCMSQYKKLFGTTRIPRKSIDEIVSICDGEGSAVSRHITVIREGCMAFVDILDENGEVFPVERLASGLMHILKNINHREGIIGAGVFTALPREEWASIWEILEKEDLNRHTLNKLKSSLFVLSFDDASPRTLEDFTIKGLVGSGRNRWCDKSLDIIVFEDGQVGLTMEHTYLDGSVVVRLCSYLVSNVKKEQVGYFGAEDCLPWEKGVLLGDEELEGKLAEAEKWLESAKAKSFFRVVEQEDIGRTSLRLKGITPDAFCQMTLQLAQYKAMGKFVNSYETIMMRHYHHGRTEALRAVTFESKEFVRTMLDKLSSPNKKWEAYIRAQKKHKMRIALCKSAKGVERHLFGLKSIYDHGGMFGVTLKSPPSLFESRSWKILNHSTIATSTSSPDGLELVCYGPVVEDGFGGRYLVFDDKVFFCLSARKEQAETLEVLSKSLMEAIIMTYRIANL
ncbi:MAG: carnitine O-acetyltransferase [Thermovirga sp.]|jgi:carnitine O-acetyltransferase|nr:carnitine O-acetyltransferase [Thermovirga sp.]